MSYVCVRESNLCGSFVAARNILGAVSSNDSGAISSNALGAVSSNASGAISSDVLEAV